MPQPSEIYTFALCLPVYHCFDYRISPEIDARPGQRYLLPFANGNKLGLLLSATKESTQEQRQLKTVDTRLDDDPLISSHLLDLGRWMADYYGQPLGEVMFLFIPRYCRQPRSLISTRQQTWQALEMDQAGLDLLSQKAPRQFQLLSALMDKPDGLNALELKKIYSAWHAQIKALQKKGLVISQWKENLPAIPDEIDAGPELTPRQNQIIQAILPTLSAFHVQVIQGVTGSGKTEIYVE